MTKEYKKGDVVIVSAEVMTAYLHKDTKEEDEEYYTEEGWKIIDRPDETWHGSYHTSVKCLFRRKFPVSQQGLVKIKVSQQGLVIGYTRKATGLFYPDRYYGPDIVPAHLVQQKRHLVVVVESLDSEQWVKPWLCLPQDVKREEGS